MLVALSLARRHLDEPTSPKTEDRFTAGIVILAPAMPILALALLSILYLAYGNDWMRAFLPVGAAVPFVWLVLAPFAGGLATYDTANRTSAGEFTDRFVALRARAEALVRQVADGARQLEPRSQLTLLQISDEIDALSSSFKKPGLSWVLGDGYIAIWQSLHRAEEAMLLLEEPVVVIEAARYDELRLKGSKITDQEAMRKQLSDAIEALATSEKRE